MSVRGCTLLEAERSQFYCTVAKNKPCCGAVIPSPWAACTPPVGGMPHVQVRHQEPRASEQRVGHAAGCCKTRCVWACGTPCGPSNAPPGLQPRSAPVTAAANAGQRNKTTLDLSNASKNRLKSGVSYATQHAFFNGRVRFPIDCKFCDRLRTNKRKKGKFALRSWRRAVTTADSCNGVAHTSVSCLCGQPKTKPMPSLLDSAA